MKVILCENVPNLGEMGMTVKVAPGYARNYLLPRKLAVPAESGSAKQIEHEMRIIKKKEEKVRAQLAEEAKKLQAISIEIKAKAGEENKIFGSVTSAQIAEALRGLGYAVDRKSVHIEEPIRTLGEHIVSVKLMRGIEANVKVLVVSAEPAAPVEAPAEAVPAEATEPAAATETKTEEEAAE